MLHVNRFTHQHTKLHFAFAAAMPREAVTVYLEFAISMGELERAITFMDTRAALGMWNGGERRCGIVPGFLFSTSFHFSPIAF